MINLKFLLGLYPSTEKIEAREAALIKEYTELETYKQSEELQSFFELKKEIESPAFAQKKQELMSLKFAGSKPDQLAKEYLNLSKSKKIVNYYKVLQSPLYQNYLKLKDSELIGEFQKHQQILNSDKFKQKQQELKTLTYKGSDEFRKEAELTQMAKSAEIKNYYKVLSSEAYKLFSLLKNSADLKHFIQLQEFAKSHTSTSDDTDTNEKIKEYNTLRKDQRFIDYFKFEASKEYATFLSTIKSGVIEKFEALKKSIESEEFKNRKAYLLLPFTRKWETTEEFEHETAFRNLSAKQEIKDYLSFIKTDAFKLFNEVSADEISHYEELEKFVNSDDFRTQKTYLNLKFEEKWKQTSEGQHETEYLGILNSDKYKWFKKIETATKFDELKKWKLTFEDDFSDSRLKEHWLTRYFWGDNFIQEGYSLSDDMHLLTDGKNLKISNSILSIETRKEKAEGKAWNPMFGFMPREFEYTSGIVNTGKSFRQKYGRFRAKIKVNSNEDIHSTIWLASNQMIPHIDIMKYNNKKYYSANFWKSGQGQEIQKSIVRMSAGKLANGFFIFELEWTPDKLVWRINDLEIRQSSQGVPDEEMYLQISAGMQSAKTSQYPSNLEIDWIRCYMRNE